MWIILTKKVPTAPAPPAGSIFWSVPYPAMSEPGKTAVRTQKRAEKRFKKLQRGIRLEDYEYLLDEFGKIPDWIRARKIAYQGHNIRVFPHEFSVMDPRAMKALIEGGACELVTETVADDRIVRGVLDGETRPIYEAALMDGANHHQAMATALGMDITLPDAEFPAIGWYKLHPAYAAYFFEAWEMAPTDEAVIPEPEEDEFALW